AIFSSEIAEKGAPSGVMVGTSAVVRGEFGTGRVFCFSPHPELTEGLHHLIPIAVEWLASPRSLPKVR
ncbi:MAG: biofilm PGA synthesis protein PgaB, partial [Planctomycetes bacterium]|nr:biofilm PGA synthesis protein PgaB [Planctomycetota bacterium]